MEETILLITIILALVHNNLNKTYYTLWFRFQAMMKLLNKELISQIDFILSLTMSHKCSPDSNI